MRGEMTHPDSDVLAEFQAGLLSGRRAAMITAHLASCPRCAATADELTGVSALLTAVPAPALPDRVAQRLEVALAAEVALRNDSERASGTSPRARPARSRRTGNRGFRWMSARVLAPAAAAVVAVAAGGYFLSSHGRPPQMQGASSAAAAPARTGPLASGSASGPLAVPADGVSPRSKQMTPAGFTVVVSPVDFQSDTLAQQLAAELRVPVTARTTEPASATIRACVDRVAGGAALVRVESAHFEGRPVTVVVTRVSQGDRVQLAGPGCSATGGRVLATRIVSLGISGP
jgi:anti-sigma factor RsiW